MTPDKAPSAQHCAGCDDYTPLGKCPGLVVFETVTASVTLDKDRSLELAADRIAELEGSRKRTSEFIERLDQYVKEAEQNALEWRARAEAARDKALEEAAKLADDEYGCDALAEAIRALKRTK